MTFATTARDAVTVSPSRFARRLRGRRDDDALDFRARSRSARRPRGPARRARRRAARRRRAGSASRPPAPRRRSPRPCSPSTRRPARGPCAAPTGRGGRAHAPTRTSSAASRAPDVRRLPPKSSDAAPAEPPVGLQRERERRAATRAPCRGRRMRGPRSGGTRRASSATRRRRRDGGGRAPRRSRRRSGAGTQPRRPGRASPSGGRCSGTRPRGARGRRASCACAAPPTHNGCHALKTSCLNPGSVISAVLIAPPSQSFRSSTQTRQPPPRAAPRTRAR